jgi:hypothetical protein
MKPVSHLWPDPVALYSVSKPSSQRTCHHLSKEEKQRKWAEFKLKLSAKNSEIGTWDVGRVLRLDFSGGARRPARGGDCHILDEVNKSESSFSELTYDTKAVVVDPDIATAINGVVQRVQPWEGAPHLQGQGILPVYVKTLSLFFYFPDFEARGREMKYRINRSLRLRGPTSLSLHFDIMLPFFSSSLGNNTSVT